MGSAVLRGRRVLIERPGRVGGGSGRVSALESEGHGSGWSRVTGCRRAEVEFSALRIRRPQGFFEGSAVLEWKARLCQVHTSRCVAVIAQTQLKSEYGRRLLCLPKPWLYF